MNPWKPSLKPAAYIVISALSLLSLTGMAEDKKSEPAPAPRQNNSGIDQESSFPKIASGKWTGPVLPDGQPNVQGFWSNTIANHNNFTDPQGGIPGSGRQPKTPRDQRAPSRVSDPASGEVPFQPWALEKVKEFQAHFHDPVEQQWVEPLARCAPGGIPKSFYWHGYEIRQYPGYVLFYFGSGTRLIHLDNKPHLPDNIKLWNGDSRGHWEGNTLVVDVKNHNGKALFGRTGEFISENGHIQERFIFSPDGNRYNYEAVFTDPTVYTRPFTVTIPARKWTERDEPNGWHFETRHAKHKGREIIVESDERICAENNAAFGMGAAANQ
ncbi:hypothetical protein [Methylobacillus sp. Pita1]|uniref:hypothetical protein n=1 Tax=Methylobacillus sp. Pita1 TaxID=3382642 RepID=UPI0038B5BBFF